MQLQWPSGLNSEQFLRDYWQQKPLLIRNAFVDFKNPLSPDELAGLACDEEFPSRLIQQESDTRWTCRHGPLDSALFSELPDTNWSLLVSDIEKHLPDFIRYVEAFRFIPDWRIDDLMISYAPKGGSVGPHTDQYDVFLLQAAGVRQWQICDSRTQNAEILPDLDLKILSHFTASKSYALYAGDLLYLPPGFAHHGISQDMQCMTWSFGFKAPSAAAMLADFARFLASRLSDELLFQDSGLALQKNPGEITKKTQEKLLQMLKDNFVTDETIFSEWIGRFLTESGNTGWQTPNADQIESHDLINELDQAKTFYRCTQSRLAFISGEKRCTLFANGEAYNSSRELAEFLCAAYKYSSKHIKNLTQKTQNLTLLRTLHQKHILYTEG